MISIRRLAVATLATAVLASPLGAAEEGAQPGMDPAAMERMQPGPEHQKLAKLAGTWDVAGKFWMSPEASPVETKGTATFETIFDGRFLEEEYQGEWMGQPFTGKATIGYDRAAKPYVSTWIDSMSTGLMAMRGTPSADGKTITYTGEMVCPMDGKRCQMRQVETMRSDDRFTFEMFQTKDGKEAKCMELTYTRKQ